MAHENKGGFFADRTRLNLEEYILLDYYFECDVNPEHAAAHLCQEQSTAQWKRVGVDEDLRERFGAKVIDLVVEGILDKPTYPFLTVGNNKTYACQVKIAHPHANFGPKIPNLLTAIGGEGTFYSPGISAIKLLDLNFPDSYLRNFQGPQFGIDGLRDILQVYDRPLLFGVIKPNLGLSPEPFADLAFQAWLGGLDIAKDDEMLGDVEWSRLEERAERLGKARSASEKMTGEKKIYLANITDEVDRLIELHDIAVARGANALMVNGMTTGLSAVRMLRKHSRVPLVAHFDFIAPFTRMPHFGVHSRVITKLQRLVGFDCIILPGFGDRMKTSDSEVMLDIEECVKPLGQIRKSLPVPAGSQWAGSIPQLFEKLKSVDFGIVPGRAVFEHPLGPKAGAASLRQAWEATRQGLTLEEYSKDHPELRAAIEEMSRK